ncbi:MAG: ECF transporter S component [Ruminococcus sp.]|nr:ECF transporter S component [Ruminococcus sp.]
MKKYVLWAIFLLGLGLTAAVGVLFSDRGLSWAATSAAVMVCGGFFAHFERRDVPSGEIALAAVMTALAVTGRVVFAALPAFKPCAAVIILAGIYLGSGQGFMIGALTALVSNFFFSQGIWTPFQMIVWGLTGLISGLLGKYLKKKKLLLCLYGMLAGLCYSLSMDMCSMFWMDGSFEPERFIGLTLTSAWFTVGYIFSNCVFLLIFVQPAERIFSRLHDKYGIGSISSDA